MCMSPGDQISRCLQIIIYYRNHCILPRSNAYNIILNEGKVAVWSNFPIWLHIINSMKVRNCRNYTAIQFTVYKEFILGQHTRKNTDLISVLSRNCYIVDQKDLGQVSQIWYINKWSWSKWLDECRLFQPIFRHIWTLVSVLFKCLYKLVLESLTIRPLYLSLN